MSARLGLASLLLLIPLGAFGQVVRVTVDDAQHGLAAPGEMRTLRVTALDVNGGPAAGETVAFVSREAGPGVDFGGESFVRVATDSAGVAEATGVVRREAGPFLIEAVVEGGEAASATIALTVPAVGAEPSISAAEARSSIGASLVDGASVLHGPFWMPPGAAVFPGGPISIEDDLVPRAVAESTWLFWIDDEPDAEFGHSTRFVLVPTGAADPASSATELYQRWWPEVLEPGFPSRSLAPPAYFNLAYTDTIVTPAAALAFEPPTPLGAPDDACALILIGPGLAGGRAGAKLFRDYLTNNDLVESENIAANTRTIGDTTFDRPATRRDLQQMLVSLAGKNCRKVYLYINAHGSEVNSPGGGGIQLSGPNEATPEEIVPYEDLMTMLQPFRSAEFCVLISSCHSGQLISWFDGRGYMGVVAMSANAEKSSRTSRAGPLYVIDFLRAARNEDADVNNDGMVSFAEAHGYLLATSRDARVTAPMPQTFVIREGGPRTMTVPNINLYSEGSLRRIEFRRPDSAPRNAPFTFMLAVQDTGIGNFTSMTGTIPAGQDSIRVPFRATDCGQTTYQLNGQDGSGAVYQATGNITVSNIRLSEKMIEMAPGDTATIDVTRFGYWFDNDKSTTLRFSSSDSSVASTTVASDFVPAGQETSSFTIRADGVGDAVITVVSRTSFSTKQIKVKVRAPVSQTSGCPTSGTADVNFAVKPGGDAGGHRDFIDLVLASLGFEASDGTIRIDSDAPQVPLLTGPFNPADCTFSAKGNSGTTRIAGFQNVDVEILNGSIDQLNLNMNFDYRVGGNGVFPGGQPTTYSATGAVTPNGATGGPFSPPGTSLLHVGGSGTISVSYDGGVSWTVTASPNSPWIQIDATPGQTFFGADQINYTIPPNNSRAPRAGGIFIDPDNGPPVEFPIQQEGSDDPSLPLILDPFNGASFEDGFTANGWMTLSGTNLSPVTREWGESDFLLTQPAAEAGTAVRQGAFLPTSLDGVSVRVNGLPASVRFVSPGQVNALSPDDPVLGEATIQIETPTGGSNIVTVDKRAVAPDLFRFNPQGGRYAAAVHPDGVLAGPEDLFQSFTTRPAEAGGVVLLFGTGFGPTDPASPASRLVTEVLWLATPLAARVGGRPAEVLFAGLIPGAGLYQINLIIPELPPGDHLVELFVEGRRIQTVVHVTVGG